MINGMATITIETMETKAKKAKTDRLQIVLYDRRRISLGLIITHELGKTLLWE